MDVFMKELFTKLVVVLRSFNFEQHTIDCANVLGANSTELTSDASKGPTPFETSLMESVSTSRILQMYPNSTYNIEYFLNVMVFGRDGNNLPLMPDETPVLTELATIDNVDIRATPNVSVTAPRRFFRIGISAVSLTYHKMKYHAKLMTFFRHSKILLPIMPTKLVPILNNFQALPWSYIKLDSKTSMPLRDENGNEIWEGYCIDFAAELAKKLDFDYVLVTPKKGTFGDRVVGMNNTWDGLVGDLMTGVSFRQIEQNTGIKFSSFSLFRISI